MPTPATCSVAYHPASTSDARTTLHPVNRTGRPEPNHDQRAWPNVAVAGAASAAVWSRDGAVLAVGTLDGQIVLWNTIDRSLQRRWQAHEAPVSQVSWDRELSTLATDSTVAVWDPSTGTRVGSFGAQGRRGHIVEWSPDHRYIAIVDSEVTVVDALSGAVLNLIEVGPHPVTTLSWAPDSTRFVTGSDDSTVVIWDAVTGAHEPIVNLFIVNAHTIDPATGERIQSISYQQESIVAVSWSPGGERVAVSNSTELGAVEIWNVGSRTVDEHLYAIFGPAETLRWSPAGDRLAMGSWEGPVTVWSADTGKLVELSLDVEPIQMIAWSPDGQRIAAAGIHDGVVLCDVETTDQEIIGGHNGWLMNVTWLDDENLVTASRDGTISQFTTSTGLGRRRFDVSDRASSFLWTVAWSPDSERVVVISGGNASLWSLTSETKLAFLSTEVDAMSVSAWSPSGDRVAVAGYGSIVVWLPAASPVEVSEVVVTTRPEMIQSVSWAPDGTRLAVGFRDGGVDIFDATTLVHTVAIDAHSDWVTAVEWSPDGKRLATASQDGSVAIWDPSLGDQRLGLDTGQEVPVSLRWSPDGSRLAAGVAHDLVIWDATVGSIVDTVAAHFSLVTSVAWSGDGAEIATTSTDGTLAITDVSAAEVTRRMPS